MRNGEESHELRGVYKSQGLHYLETYGVLHDLEAYGVLLDLVPYGVLLDLVPCGVLLVLCLSPWWWIVTAVVAITNVPCQPWVYVQEAYRFVPAGLSVLVVAACLSALPLEHAAGLVIHSLYVRPYFLTLVVA